MRVRGKTDVDVEITTKELVSALKEEVYAAMNLPNPRQGRVYIKDGRWVIEKSVHTTHAFEIEEDLGLAIEDDTEVFTAFHTLAEFLRD
jgi:hypothetical protein|tara:strand:+ start:21685 stop:21951 length:267 start_codon:yes stop_codon:yes gene_type:complete